MEQGEQLGGEMSFWDHLEVLRWSLFRILGVLAVMVIVSFIFMPWLFDHFIMAPTGSDFFVYRWMSRLGGGEAAKKAMLLPNFANPDFHVEIINIKVASQFLTHVSTSFWLALVAAFPYIVFEIWRFISPALYEREKKSLLGGFVFGTLMFYVGCAVGYCIVFPFTFRFLTEYQLSTDIVNQISLNSYMSNFLSMIFIMGLVFEIPLLALVLSSLGLLDKGMLRAYRKYAVVVIMILAAVITPSGDPFTLMVVFLPIYMLYELSILIVRSPAKDADDPDDVENGDEADETDDEDDAEDGDEADETGKPVDAGNAAAVSLTGKADEQDIEST